MPCPVQPDRTDRAIINPLQRDASISNVALTDTAKLSAPACLRRAERLKQAGLIRGLDNSWGCARCRLRSESDQPQAQRLECGRCTSGALQFAEHAFDVSAHRTRADAKLTRHFLVAAALTDAAQDLCFTFGEWAAACSGDGHGAPALLAQAGLPRWLAAQCLQGQCCNPQPIADLHCITFEAADVAAAIEPLIRLHRP